MMKEKVLEAFRELGFLLEQVEETEWYSFNYEGINFIYLPNSDDEVFLSISVPGIYDLQDDNVANFVAITEKINSSIKYVKAYRLGDSIWLFYERELIDEENLKSVISQMIMHLEAALFFARNFQDTLDTDKGQEEKELLDYIEETEESEN